MGQNRNIQDSGTHNSRYFTGCFSVILLRVTVDSEFLYFKLFRDREKEREIQVNLEKLRSGAGEKVLPVAYKTHLVST